MAKGISEAIEQLDYLFRNENVSAIAQGEHRGRDCIVVFLIGEDKALETILPEQVEGFEVIVRYSGEISAQ